MRYKIELKCVFCWDDAGWTEETDGVTRPLRFATVDEAQEALDKYFAHVKTAVLAGNMDTEAVSDDYRIFAVR